jgi:hypothetical protein
VTLLILTPRLPFKEYSFNYLGKTFWFVAFFSMKSKLIIPYNMAWNFPLSEFGFKAKHFNFLEANDIKYSSQLL